MGLEKPNPSGVSLILARAARSVAAGVLLSADEDMNADVLAEKEEAACWLRGLMVGTGEKPRATLKFVAARAAAAAETRVAFRVMVMVYQDEITVR
mmetsp:Transcript_4982/g.9712  ORF Transcript_4982/g.9712 Transcript_4982/m.9712 type:complete len:96 (-) Transcript_4982:2-289(-)